MSAVPEEKSKLSQQIRGQGGHLIFRSARKKNPQNWYEMLRSSFLSIFVEFRSAVSGRKSKMYQQISSQGGHLVFPIDHKNTNLVEDFEILLTVKFRWIPFSGFRVEVENVSANQRPGRPFFFSIDAKNIKLEGHVEILLPVKFRWIPLSGFREVENVSANERPGQPSCFSDQPNSVQKFQRRSRKCLSQSEARVAIVFLIGKKNTDLFKGVKILLPIKLHWIPFSGFQWRSRKCLSKSVARVAVVFRSARKTQTWCRTLRSCFLSSCIEFCSMVSEEESKMSQPITSRGGHIVFFFRSAQKHKIGRGRWYLAPSQTQFRWILLSRFRGEGEYVSANQRPGIGAKNTILVEDVEILLPV